MYWKDIVAQKVEPISVAQKPDFYTQFVTR